MPAGRPPKAVIDTKKNHMSKDELKSREAHTPVYARQDFKVPETLNEAETAVWNHLVEIYRAMSNCPVSDADRDLMEIYCRAKVAFDEADAELKVHPDAYVRIPIGYDKNMKLKWGLKANPNIKKRQDNANLCIKLFGELGLSPNARAKVGISGANADKNEPWFKSLLNWSDDDD